jgi:hypothetical protein
MQGQLPRTPAGDRKDPHPPRREEHVGTSRSVSALPGAAAGGLVRLINRSPRDQHQRLRSSWARQGRGRPAGLNESKNRPGVPRIRAIARIGRLGFRTTSR